jgi:hypothetical protein
VRFFVYLLALAAAAQTGVPPRSASSEYPAHHEGHGVAEGAAIVPASQVAKVFTSRIAKDYVVVEFALYPAAGPSADLHTLDFALNDGADSRTYPATPDEVAWHGQKPPATSSTQLAHITAEVGIVAGSRTDPYNGRQEHGVAGYGGVAVDNRPAPPPAQTGPVDDPWAVAGRLRRMMLPEGQTDQPVAGYLYFPRPSGRRPRNGSWGLEYSVGADRRELILPLR